MSVTTMPPLVTRSQIERNLRARAIKKHIAKKGGSGSIFGDALGIGRTVAEGPELFVLHHTPVVSTALGLGEDAASTVGNLPSEVGEAAGIVNPVETLAKEGPAGIVKSAEQTASGVTNTVKAVESTGEALHTLTSPHTWIRFGKVIAGGLVILLGLYLLVKIVSPAAAAAPGKAVKGVAKGARLAASAA